MGSLNRVENGQTLLTVHLARSMMDLCHWRPDDLVERVRQARGPGWWTDDPPVALHVVLSEHVLHRPVGGVDVMRAQLRHLALVVELLAAGR